MIEPFSTKFNLNFTVYLLTLVFEKLPTQFYADLERSYLHLTNQLSLSYQDSHIY